MLPKTYRNLLKNDITNDFTMGYASQPGFRASICSPFYFYDIEKEVVSNLKVFPFVVMDATLLRYLKLKPEQAIEHIRKLVNEVKSVNGMFIFLWHNDSLCDTGEWRGWKIVYEEMIKMALPEKSVSKQ
jgi:hypothetical protein